MVAKIDGTNGVLQQYDYQVPTTGFSYTFAAGTTVLVMNPAGTLATGTITMPAAPADGMTISFSSTQAITALTVAGNTGQSIVGNPTTMLAGGAATFMYLLSNTTWYAQLNTVQVGSAGSPAPVVTIYTSPSPWTKSPTLKGVTVFMVSGGGSGGAGTGAASTGSGSGGGGGGVGNGYFPAASIPGPVTVTVGSGGAAVNATGPTTSVNGNSGGTSSFGALFSITGGGGGGASTPGGSSGGAGGVVTPSPQIIGKVGYAGANAANGTSSAGGSSAFYWGDGGAAITAIGGGTAGPGYGGGGGGARFGTNTGVPTVSASGKAGVIVVEEFY